MADNNEWLWEVEDEPVDTALRAESAAEGPLKAWQSEDAVKGARLHLAGRSDEAMKVLTAAAGKNEHLAEIYAVLGQIQFEKQKYADAAATFAKLTDVEPRHRTAYYNHGVCLLRSGDKQAAATAFERALNVDPNRAGARLGLGLCRLATGDHAGALEHLNKYLGAGGDDIAALIGK
ncbi:MAG TPA: tetratricopeptide repeat protein, partial [Bryobacteraceae bacterium]|nr:tetratricopeptide repeat protein [Bryobacteraceae bacterium]